MIAKSLFKIISYLIFTYNVCFFKTSTVKHEKITFPIKTFKKDRNKLLTLQEWFRLFVRVLCHEGEVLLEINFSGETGDSASLQISCELAALQASRRKTLQSSTEWTNRPFPTPETWAAQMATRRKITSFLLQGEVCLTISLETKYQSIFTVFYFFSDELGWVSFADEDFQQPQLGFNVLVFVVLQCQWGAVLFLHISVGCGWKINSKKVRRLSSWKPIILFYNTNKFFFFFYLPFCLKNWSSNSFRFLRILFFSSLVSWSCSTSSCLWD